MDRATWELEGPNRQLGGRVVVHCLVFVYALVHVMYVCEYGMTSDVCCMTMCIRTTAVMTIHSVLDYVVC